MGYFGYCHVLWGMGPVPALRESGPERGGPSGGGAVGWRLVGRQAGR